MNVAMPLASCSRAAFAAVRNKLCALAIACLAALSLASGHANAIDLLNGDEDFKLLASLGFEQAVDGAHAQGSQLNSYAWSMAWFKGKLYVGTGRFEVDGTTGQPTAGQIWAYTPGGPGGASGTWALVFTAPDLFGNPREFGYRWMTACNFRGIDYLFISTLGTLQGNILYTSDGVSFTPVSRGGIPFQSVGFRTMVCFTEQSGQKVLVTSPVGQLGGAGGFDSDRTDNPIALANSDPTLGAGWRNYSLMGMGDPNSNSYFAMYATNGWLYAGVSNEVTGGQLWRTRGCPQSLKGQSCTPTWTKIIDKGGGRLPSPTGVVGNKGFSDMMAYNGSLYLALSSPAADQDRIRAELFRLRPDDTFEVLIGEPRLNVATNPNLPANFRCGLPLEDIDGAGGANDCPPTSRRGAGLGPVSDAGGGYPQGTQFYFWRLFNYAFDASTAPLGDNRLYLGTLQGGGRGSGQQEPGFDMLVTTDGANWLTVTGDGFGYTNQQGLRSIAASPYGLFVGGTHFPGNNLGSNPIRGCNVFLGVPLPDTLAPTTTIASPPSPNESDVLNVRSATFSWSGADAPGTGSLPLTYAYRLDPLEPSYSAFGAAATKTYAMLPNGTFTFFVIAKDNSGNIEAPGTAPGAPNRRTFSVSAPDLPPTVAITIAPASPNNGNVNLAWSGSDDVTPPASLVYDYWLAPLQSDPGTFIAGTSKSYSGLANGPYTFHVTAKDGAGNVGTEATASFTVASPPPTPASASASVTAPRTVRVTWPDVAGETSYTVQRCTYFKSCAYVSIATNVPADATLYDDVLAQAGTYGYRVQACNAVGCSGYATTANVFVP